MTRPGEWFVTGTGDRIDWNHTPPEVGWATASSSSHGKRDAESMVLIALADLADLKEKEAFLGEWLADVKAAHPVVFQRIVAEHPEALEAWRETSGHETGA